MSHIIEAMRKAIQDAPAMTPLPKRAYMSNEALAALRSSFAAPGDPKRPVETFYGMPIVLEPLFEGREYVVVDSSGQLLLGNISEERKNAVTAIVAAHEAEHKARLSRPLDPHTRRNSPHTPW